MSVCKACVALAALAAPHEHASSMASPSSASHPPHLQVLAQHGQTLRLIAVVGHDRAGAGHNLLGIALSVDAAQAGHLAQLQLGGHADQVHVLLSAQGLNQLLVVGGVGVLSQDAQLGLRESAKDVL